MLSSDVLHGSDPDERRVWSTSFIDRTWFLSRQIAGRLHPVKPLLHQCTADSKKSSFPFLYRRLHRLRSCLKAPFATPDQFVRHRQAWCRLPRAPRGPAVDRPDDMLAPLSGGRPELVSFGQHGPGQPRILGGDGNDRLAVTGPRLQSECPATHCIAFAGSERQH